MILSLCFQPTEIKNAEMIFFFHHEGCKSEKRGAQAEGKCSVFHFLSVTKTPPHLQCTSKYYQALLLHYYQKIDVRTQEFS